MKDIYIYPAIFDYAEDGISVSFPDLPNCITCGDNDEEAFHMAKDVLEGYLYLAEKDNELIPEPSSFQNLRTKQNQRLVLIEVNMKRIK